MWHMRYFTFSISQWFEDVVPPTDSLSGSKRPRLLGSLRRSKEEQHMEGLANGTTQIVVSVLCTSVRILGHGAIGKTRCSVEQDRAGTLSVSPSNHMRPRISGLYVRKSTF